MLIRYFKKRFAAKIVLSTIAVVFISMIFNSFVFYLKATNVVKDNVRESSLQIARQGADALSFILSFGSDMSDLIYSNEQLQEIVMKDTSPTLSLFERTQNNEYFNTYLNSNIFSSSFARIIYVFKEEGTSWGSGTFSAPKLSKYKITELDWVMESVEMDGEAVWQGLQFDRFSGAGENTQLILPISKVMKDFNTMDNIAYIQIALDGNAILETISNLKLGKTGKFFVVDQEGKVMIDSNMELINQPVANKELYENIKNKNAVEFEFTQASTAYYGVKQPINNGWLLVGIVPIEEITGELTSIQVFTIITTVLFAIVTIMVGLAAAKRVTEPIHILTNQMELVGKGNFQVETKIKSTDEIGMMSKQFNRMITQIEQLLRQVKEEQDQKKEAELRAIRHRINSHFLFNTLSTIRWLVKFNQSEKANTALTALSRLLEANMGKKGTFVTLKEELDIVKKFIDILQIRYEQNFHLQQEIDPEVEEFLIPQMLIQPIVENAIFHGIVQTGKEGNIIINGRSLENGILIEIIDNGIGIKAEILQQLGELELWTSRKNSFVGIGLGHVFDSVHLYFAAESKIEMGRFNEGTKVSLRLVRNLGGEKSV